MGSYITYDPSTWENFHKLAVREEYRAFAAAYQLTKNALSGLVGYYTFVHYPGADGAFGYTDWELGDTPLSGMVPSESAYFFRFLQAGIVGYMADTGRRSAWAAAGIPGVGSAADYWKVFCEFIGLVDAETGAWGWRYVDELDENGDFKFKRTSEMHTPADTGYARSGHYAGPHLLEDLKLCMDAIETYYPPLTYASTAGSEDSSGNSSSQSSATSSLLTPSSSGTSGSSVSSLTFSSIISLPSFEGTTGLYTSMHDSSYATESFNIPSSEWWTDGGGTGGGSGI